MSKLLKLQLWVANMNLAKTMIITSVILIVTLALSSIVNYEIVTPGYGAIVVDKLGEEREIKPADIRTGLILYSPVSTSIIIYPTAVQRAVYSKDPTEGSSQNTEVCFNDSDSVSICTDISASFRVDYADLGKFYTKYRLPDIQTFVDGIYRDRLRDAFGNVAGGLKVEAIKGRSKGDVTDKVTTLLNEQFKNDGIITEAVGFASEPRIPGAIEESINNKVVAQQQNEKAKTDAKTREEVSRGLVLQATQEAEALKIKSLSEAEANRVLTASLTPEVLEKMRIDLQLKATGAGWNGVLPTYMAGNVNAMPLPLLTVPSP